MLRFAPSRLCSPLQACYRAVCVLAVVRRRQRVVCVALYATDDIRPGEEVYVHYGDSKGRDYEVGDAAAPLYKKDIAHDELPFNFLPAGESAMHDGFRYRDA